MKFESLPLVSQLLSGVAECGYLSLTPVQEKVIPLALKGGDLMACAETGTGKTAAFGLPVLQMVMAAKEDVPCLRGLILTPTRELAIQVAQSLSNYASQLNVEIQAVYGGANINPQRKAIAQGVDILVATPGRLFDLIGQHGLSLADVNCLVVDEADRMLDLGFVRDIEKVKTLISPSHQTMLFSATFSDSVRKLSNKMLLSPTWINIDTKSTKARIEQCVYLVDKRRKAEMLAELIGRNNWQQVLVFTSTKESAEHYVKELKLDGVKASVFHGDKTQGARNRALDDFKSGAIRALVATDVAARGLDIQALPLVINLELPDDSQDYVHRIGRTGRAGLSGQAFSFISPSEEKALKEIEVELGYQIARRQLAGYEIGAPLPERYRQISALDSNKGARKQKHDNKQQRRSDRASRSNKGSSKSKFSSAKESSGKRKVNQGSKLRKVR